jgi:hypothetical protein
MDVNRPNVMRIQATYTQTRGSKWPNLYIPSTLNTQTKLLSPAIWANKSGLACGRLASTSSKSQRKSTTQIIILNYLSQCSYTDAIYHCHKPVFRPKMAIFQRARMREGGLLLPLGFQYLILMI